METEREKHIEWLQMDGWLDRHDKDIYLMGKKDGAKEKSKDLVKLVKEIQMDISEQDENKIIDEFANMLSENLKKYKGSSDKIISMTVIAIKEKRRENK